MGPVLDFGPQCIGWVCGQCHQCKCDCHQRCEFHDLDRTAARFERSDYRWKVVGKRWKVGFCRHRYIFFRIAPFRNFQLSISRHPTLESFDVNRNAASHPKEPPLAACAAHPSLPRLTSGATASSTSPASASSSPTTFCSWLPSRRIDTARFSASFLPTTSSTGTLARECSRTL